MRNINCKSQNDARCANLEGARIWCDGAGVRLAEWTTIGPLVSTLREYGPLLTRRASSVGSRNDESWNGKEASSEKEMGAVCKKTAPLEPLGNFTGILACFSRGAPAPLEPLAKCPRSFDGLWCGESLQRCAPGRKAAIAGNNGYSAYCLTVRGVYPYMSRLGVPR